MCSPSASRWNHEQAPLARADHTCVAGRHSWWRSAPRHLRMSMYEKKFTGYGQERAANSSGASSSQARTNGTSMWEIISPKPARTAAITCAKSLPGEASNSMGMVLTNQPTASFQEPRPRSLTGMNPR